MPYINTCRVGAPTTTDYLTWQEALDSGLQELVREALDEPGVLSVELQDDCRSRVLRVENARTGVAVAPPQND